MYPHHAPENHNCPLWREDGAGKPIPNGDGAIEHARDQVAEQDGETRSVIHATDPTGLRGFYPVFKTSGGERLGAFYMGADKAAFDLAKDAALAGLKKPTPEEIAFAERMAALDP